MPFANKSLMLNALYGIKYCMHSVKTQKNKPIINHLTADNSLLKKISLMYLKKNIHGQNNNT